MVRATDPLVATDAVIREIAQEVHRKFALVSENIQIHLDEHTIMIVIHTTPERLSLPQGPRDIRISHGNPILEPPTF